MMLITTLVVSVCKDGGGSFNVNIWFLVVYVRCEVLCALVAAGNVFIFVKINIYVVSIIVTSAVADNPC